MIHKRGGETMKYFDTLANAVEEAFRRRGVLVNELLYCVKADMDGEGCYIDQYIAFTKDAIYMLSGYETFDHSKGKKKREDSTFDVSTFIRIELSEVKELSVDRLQHTARLMLRKNTDEEQSMARFSLGYSEKFELFAERLNLTIEGKPIDDSLLESKKTHCPTCGERYPDINRPICPMCINKHSVFRRLLGMFKEFKVAIVAIVVCFALSAIFTAFTPYISNKTLYDEVLSSNGKYYGDIVYIVVLMIAVNVISRVLGLVSGVILAIVVPKVTHQLRCKIFSSMQRLSLPFFTSKQTGSLMTRIDNDSDNVYWFFVDILPYGLTNISKIIGISLIMFRLSPILSLGVFITIIAMETIQERFFRKQRKLYRKLHIATSKGNSVLSDALNGQRVVKAFAKEKEETKRYGKSNDVRFEMDRIINYGIADTIPGLRFMVFMVTYLTFILGAIMIMRGQLVFGVLASIISYSNMLYEPINFFAWIGNRWANCVDAASRMFEILDSEPIVKECEHPVRKERLEGNIQFHDVSFEYEAGRPILKGLNFQVKAGQMFGIVGKTGAGKSTLIQLIARLYDVTRGEITLDGIPMKQIAIEDLRRNIGIVSQESYIFSGSVADNIRYARPDATMEEVIEAAKASYAHEFIVKLADGYNTRIGAGGASLSGGEKQRISIARAMIQKPSILILDEATASMDTRTERKIQLAIDELKQGRTIISIAHRLSTLRDADVLCVIEHGEVKEMGTHQELIDQKGSYYELYRLQADAIQFMDQV